MTGRPVPAPTPQPERRREPLRDQFGRVIDYLRISITDRCNLRCTYCMPLEHPDLAESSRVLTADEIVEIVGVAADLGFRKIRLTGGEPTLRKDLLDIVRRIAATPGIDDVALTTNGVLLPKLAQPLAEAGLRRVNVHVDTLDEGTLPQIMRLGSLAKIRAGIQAAVDAGLTPLKLNVVVVRGMNDAQVAELAALTLEHDWHVRFIELMPLGASVEATYAVERYVSNESTRARIEAVHGPLQRLPKSHASDESDNFRLAGAPGVVGFISPVSRPFCGACNRMRLTADGRFHLCLLKDDELDLRKSLRDGDPAPAARRERIADILRRAVSGKPTGHALREGFHTKGRRMHQIGG